MESVMDQVMATVLDADVLPPRYLNEQLRELMARGESVVVQNPRSRHNLGVALPGPGQVTFKGSVGYYCGGLSNGGVVEGGVVVVGGSIGFLSGFMAQRGKLIAVGDAADGVGDSLYEGNIFVAGRIHGLGIDAVTARPTAG